MTLDRMLQSQGFGSRKWCRQLVEDGEVTVNGVAVDDYRMTVDSDGYLYVASKMGIQICDQAGRVMAIISKPQMASLSNVVFGGADLHTLYATNGDKVYRRHLRAKGVLPWTVVTPPKPQL